MQLFLKLAMWPKGFLLKKYPRGVLKCAIISVLLLGTIHLFGYFEVGGQQYYVDLRRIVLVIISIYCIFLECKITVQQWLIVYIKTRKTQCTSHKNMQISYFDQLWYNLGKVCFLLNICLFWSPYLTTSSAKFNGGY